MNKISLYVGIFVLVFIYTAVFAPCLESFFVIDDIDWLDSLFRQNSFLTSFREPIIMPFRFRPIDGISFFICYNLFGLNPKGYLVLSMLISIIGLVVLYYFILILTKNKALGFLSCFLIAMHPFHIQKLISVMLSRPLGFLFFSSTLLCYFLSISTLLAISKVVENMLTIIKIKILLAIYLLRQ